MATRPEFLLAEGTPAEGQIPTYTSGVPIWANPTGGAVFTTEVVTDTVTITTVPGASQEHIIEVNTAHASWDALDTVTLPASPTANSKYTICDGGDNAGTEGIRIDPNGYNISGRAGNLDITIDGGSVTLYFTGTQYLLMG